MKADCPYCLADACFPCRAHGGGVDFARLARVLVESLSERPGDRERDHRTWTMLSCIEDIIEDPEGGLLELLTCVLDATLTVHQASVVAAGIVEESLCKHGALVLDHLEVIAARSAKLRYVLSGVWGRRDMEPEIWRRLCGLVGRAGRMDDDARTPMREGAGPVLERVDAEERLRMPIVDARPGVPCFGARRDDLRYEVRPGAYAILRDWERRIAIVRTPTGVFLPGGGVDFDEHEPADLALARELLEECGIHCAIRRELFEADEFVWSPKYERAFLKRGVFFEVHAIGCAEALEDDHELVWAPPERARELLPPESQRWAVTRSYEILSS